jgi:NAD(P)-dependent dehydrogenase (short-subunit alcohol dehydrogenase family)
MNAKNGTVTNKVALITGALTGIGRGTALAFAREGAKVVISGRRAEAGEGLLDELHKLGAEAEFVLTDVRKEDDVKNLVDRAVSRFGRLDIAVNNAGTADGSGPIAAQTAESYAAIFDTNVLGVLLCLKHEFRVMLPQKSGSIINISSTFGRRGAANTSVYCASKHAVEGLSKVASIEAAAAGVRVNVVAPGPIDTQALDKFTKTAEVKAKVAAANPLGRIGTVDEVAELIVFVSSDRAPFINGTTLGIDGGKLA